MNKVLGFLIAASVTAVSSGAAPGAARAETLYNQNSNYAGAGINSENFTSSFSLYDDQAADDFVVPQGDVWRVTDVDVSGQYQNGSNFAQSENVVFYRSRDGIPGTALPKGTFNQLRGRDSAGNFAIRLPGGGLRLNPGHYWVSVVINTGFNGAYWYWNENAVRHNSQAVWQNPEEGWGYSCETWCAIKNAGATGPDLMFALKGTTKAGSVHRAANAH